MTKTAPALLRLDGHDVGDLVAFAARCDALIEALMRTTSISCEPIHEPIRENIATRTPPPPNAVLSRALLTGAGALADFVFEGQNALACLGVSSERPTTQAFTIRLSANGGWHGIPIARGDAAGTVLDWGIAITRVREAALHTAQSIRQGGYRAARDGRVENLAAHASNAALFDLAEDLVALHHPDALGWRGGDEFKLRCTVDMHGRFRPMIRRMTGLSFREDVDLLVPEAAAALSRRAIPQAAFINSPDSGANGGTGRYVYTFTAIDLDHQRPPRNASTVETLRRLARLDDLDGMPGQIFTPEALAILAR